MPDGLTRSQRYYLRHRDRVRAANRAWAAANPTAAKAIQQRYERAHAAQRAAKASAYKAAHRERWKPAGRYHRPHYPNDIRTTIAALNQLRKELNK